MKLLLLAISFSTALGCLVQTEIAKKADEDHQSFNLTYLYAGLGSGMGTIQPVFRVKGPQFVYTLEQNSFYGKKTVKPDTIHTGKFSHQSIKMILDIIKPIEDTLIYKLNPNVMSGGIHEIGITNDSKKLTFRLHNAPDSTAKKIVDILNVYIPDGERKLWLFPF